MRGVRVLGAGLAVLGGLLLAGCGSGAGSGPPPTAAAPTMTAAAASTAGSPTGSGRGRPVVPERLVFTGTTVDGAAFDAAGLAGRPVVLWFWAPWCPKCRAAGPRIASIAADYSGRVTVVGVAGLSTDAGSMRQFVADTRTGSLTHLADPAGAVWKRFGVTTQDAYVLVAADGSVTHTGHLDVAELARRVDALAG